MDIQMFFLHMILMNCYVKLAMHLYMYMLLFTIFFIILKKVNSYCSLDIKESGINKINPGDVGMVLYILVRNPCKRTYYVSTRMIRCVELIGEREEETEAMYLIGGYMGSLNPYSSKKVTLIYPNMYLYNRKATCQIAITYMDDEHNSRDIETFLRIDTTLRDNVPPYEIQTFYAGKFCNCDTVDQDELSHCEPVNCMMKYLGYRSYFNKKWKRCVKVPVCVADPLLDEPDVSYLPQNNKCRNLNTTITEDDLDILEEGRVNNITEKCNPANGLIFRCNHGSLDPTTGYCVCKKGWTSGETNLEAYLPGLNNYHMCNIRLNSWKGENIDKIRKTILAFSIMGVIVASVVVIMTISLYALFQRIKSPARRNSNYNDCSCG